MTQTEISLLDTRLKNISVRNVIAIVATTGTWVATVLTVYSNFKTEQQLMKLQMKILEQRVDRLENAGASQHSVTTKTNYTTWHENQKQDESIFSTSAKEHY